MLTHVNRFYWGLVWSVQFSYSIAPLILSYLILFSLISWQFAMQRSVTHFNTTLEWFLRSCFRLYSATNVQRQKVAVGTWSTSCARSVTASWAVSATSCVTMQRSAADASRSCFPSAARRARDPSASTRVSWWTQSSTGTPRMNASHALPATGERFHRCVYCQVRNCERMES